MNKKQGYHLCLVRPLPTFFEAMALQQVHRQRPRSPQVDRHIFLGAHSDCFKFDLPWNEQSTGTKPIEFRGKPFLGDFLHRLVGRFNKWRQTCAICFWNNSWNCWAIKIKTCFWRQIFAFFPQICKMSSFISTPTGYVEYHHCATGFCHKQTAIFGCPY